MAGTCDSRRGNGCWRGADGAVVLPHREVTAPDCGPTLTGAKSATPKPDTHRPSSNIASGRRRRVWRREIRRSVARYRVTRRGRIGCRVTLRWVGRWRKARCRIVLRRIRRRRVLWRVAVTWRWRSWRHGQLATVGGLSGYLIAALVHALHVSKIEPLLQTVGSDLRIAPRGGAAKEKSCASTPRCDCARVVRPLSEQRADGGAEYRANEDIRRSLVVRDFGSGREQSLRFLLAGKAVSLKLRGLLFRARQHHHRRCRGRHGTTAERERDTHSQECREAS
jgi:hypothetical protein